MPTVPHPEASQAAAEHDVLSPRAHDPASKDQTVSQLPFALAIFLSAFLLFQVQLLLGKQILPVFGGAPAVWTSCLLVFQLLLLAGYAFAPGLALRLTLRAQALVQLSLLCLSLLLVATLSRVWPSPITPGAGWRPEGDADPTWLIIRFLLAAIGLPFFLLSTTSPLAQHWFAKTAKGRSPYRLYALSNAGSLLGLLSYPILIEPNLRLHTQAWLWTLDYVAYAVAFAFCAVLTLRESTGAIAGAKATDAQRRPEPRPGWPASVLWITLAASASVLLLATTNFICQEVAVIPFLWVLPLCLYLLSFIFCFESDRWYRRNVFHALFALATGAVILATLPNADYSYLVQLAACSALLFTGCMVCHGEAARTRPSAGHLTQFYLCISTGGALGGIFVSLLAPRIFPNYWEYPLHSFLHRVDSALGHAGCFFVVVYGQGTLSGVNSQPGCAIDAQCTGTGIARSAVLNLGAVGAGWRASCLCGISLRARAANRPEAAATMADAPRRARNSCAAHGWAGHPAKSRVISRHRACEEFLRSSLRGRSAAGKLSGAAPRQNCPRFPISGPAADTAGDRLLRTEQPGEHHHSKFAAPSDARGIGWYGGGHARRCRTAGRCVPVLRDQSRCLPLLQRAAALFYVSAGFSGAD